MRGRIGSGGRALVVCSILLLAGGCNLIDRRDCPPTAVTTDVTLEATKKGMLERDLWDVLEFAESRITQAANRVEAGTDDPAIRRAALAWKLELLVDAKHDLAAKDPLEMLVDLWALWVRVVRYLQQGEGQDLFGEFQPEAIAAASEILERIKQLARDYLPPEKHTAILRQVNTYARGHPMENVFEHETVPDFCKEESGHSAIRQLFGLPMKAVSTVGAELDPTTRLARAVDRFTALMSDYPAVVRWQLQLALLDIERLPTVERTLASVQQAADAASQFNETIAQLPERLRAESEQLLARADEGQAEVRGTLEEARRTVAAADEALARADEVTGRVRETATELTRTGEAWAETAGAVKETLQEIQAFGERRSASTRPSAAQREQAPFDIRDYTKTATELRDATSELRRLLTDLDDFAAEDGPVARSTRRAEALTTDVLAQTELRLRDVVDHAFWRALQLALIVLVMAIVYRVFTWRAATARQQSS